MRYHLKMLGAEGIKTGAFGLRAREVQSSAGVQYKLKFRVQALVASRLYQSTPKDKACTLNFRPELEFTLIFTAMPLAYTLDKQSRALHSAKTRKKFMQQSSMAASPSLNSGWRL